MPLPTSAATLGTIDPATLPARSGWLYAPARRLAAWFEGLVDPYPEALPAIPPKGLLPFLWRCTEGLRAPLLLMSVCTALIGVFEAVLFGMLGRIVDWLGATPPERLFSEHGTGLLTLAALLVASPIVVGAQTMFKHQSLAGNFPMRLRWNFHRLMLGQSLAFYQDEFAGRVAAKVMQTALAARDAIFIVTDILVFVAVFFLTLGVVLAGFDLRLLLPFIVWLALYLLALRWFIPRLAKVSQAQADARALMTGRVTDAYANITTVKLFSHARREAAYAKGAMQDFLGTVHGQMRYVSAFETVIHSLSMSLVLGTTALALWSWHEGSIGLGAVAAATAMALRLNGFSHWIMWEMSALFEHVGTVQDGINTLSRPYTVLDRPGAVALSVPRGEIRFEGVGFSYAAGKARVLDDFHLTIAPGEKIGLVGRSGAGKSTLVNLLLRFHDIQAGRITIDGQDIASVTQESLRARIGMVTQDTSLLHRSVRDNILYGRPDADEVDLHAAATRSEASDFIATLADAKGRAGFEAHVGERGVKLSGGQRQRIAIARVMLEDAPILLLDEATSALDSEVEVAIQQSLYKLMEGKTVVAIAHRLSTIAAMDRLIVLDAGRIVEQGSHAELLAAGGLYARLWAHQSGGFLGASDSD